MEKISDEVLKTLGAIITEALTNGDSVALPGFGTFHPVKEDEHVETDANGTRMLVPPAITVNFTPAIKLLKSIKEKGGNS